MNMKAIYPGSFDPVTKGHMDIIHRSASIFDEVIVAVLENKRKESLFTIQERVKLLQQSIGELHTIKNVKVESFSGLLVDFCRQKKSNIIIRGLRAVSDYEYEMQMALVNKQLDDDIETFFLASRGEYAYLSSSIVKEVASFGGEFKDFIPECVYDKMIERLKGGQDGIN